MMKLLIVDAAEEFRSALMAAMKGTYVIRACDNGEEALELARTFAPDLLILDLTVPGVDGLSLVQLITQTQRKPIVLVTTRFISEYITDAADRIGIDYMMRKPCNIRAVVTRMEDLVASRDPHNQPRPDPKVTVANLLLALGIATNNKGYTYLREAVPIYAQDPQQAITKELYPAVAKLCGGNGKQVERSMRTAINKAWKERNEQVWRLYFRPSADGTLKRPSNAVFISRLAELTTRQAREQNE